MKQFYIINSVFLTGIISVLFSSCTKVIDVDLNTNNPQYVIEAFVTLGKTTHQVSITKTLNIDESTAYPTVDNATVLITDDLGNSQTMALVSPGIYEASAYAVSVGRTYTLTVNVDSKVFVANGIMPQDVQLDSIETFPFSFGPTTINSIVPVRLDPAGIENFYQFKLLNQGSYLPGIFIQSDQYNDGNQMMEPLFAEDINSGDTVLVEMYGIDKMVYEFYYTLMQNDQGATPANPTSNFSGGCIGYFSVRTMDTMSLIIP